jgi:hypothetical protein
VQSGRSLWCHWTSTRLHSATNQNIAMYKLCSLRHCYFTIMQCDKLYPWPGWWASGLWMS